MIRKFCDVCHRETRVDKGSQSSILVQNVVFEGLACYFRFRVTLENTIDICDRCEEDMQRAIHKYFAAGKIPISWGNSPTT